MSLARLLGRPVRVLIGDPPEPYPAYGLRPCDLADFEALALASQPDPRDTLPDEDVDTPEHRAALLAAFEVAEATDGGPDHVNRWLFGTHVGLRAFVRAVLREDDLHDDGRCDAFMAKITPRQWLRLQAVAFGVSAADEIIARIDRVIGCPPMPKGGGVPWPRALCELVEAYPAYTVESASTLTLEAINWLRAGGKMPEAGGVDLSHASPDQVAVWKREIRPRRRAFFKGEGWGESMPEAESLRDPQPHPSSPENGSTEAR